MLLGAPTRVGLDPKCSFPADRARVSLWPVPREVPLRRAVGNRFSIQSQEKGLGLAARQRDAIHRRMSFKPAHLIAGYAAPRVAWLAPLVPRRSLCV